MRPKTPILLCCVNEFQANQLGLILETRLRVDVTVSSELGAVAAMHGKDFHCAVLVCPTIEFINILRKREISSLEIGKSPSYADRAVASDIREILEAVRIMCARKRGPKRRVA